MSRNRNAEVCLWHAVAQRIDAPIFTGGICRALYESKSKRWDVYANAVDRLTAHRRVHHGGYYDGFYIYEGEGTALPENRDARVLACLWMAQEALEGLEP